MTGRGHPTPRAHRGRHRRRRGVSRVAHERGLQGPGDQGAGAPARALPDEPTPARGKSLQSEAAAAQAAPALMLTGTLDLVAFISIAASSISQQKLELPRSLPQFKAGPRNQL